MEDTNNTISTTQQTVETQVDNRPPIPEELDGIPEDIAREVMQEVDTAQQQETAPQPQSTEQPETEETEEATAPDDEAAVENNASTGEDEDNVPKHPIPYTRFKEKVDEANKLKAEIAELKKLMEQQRQQPPQVVYQQPPQVQQPVQPSAAPQPAFTYEQAQMINNRIFAVAKEMTGMSQEEIDAVQYAEDGDAKKSLWNMAVDIARSSVVADIRKQAADAVIHRETMLNQQQQAMADYSAYVGQQTSEQDFKAVSEYAQNEYFLAQSQIKQRAIADAYNRVTRNVASPQDMFLVTQYFDAAKADYRTKQATAKQQQTKPPAPAQAKKTPTAPQSKFDQIGGTVTVQNSPSLEQIEKLMQKTPFDELPKDIQHLLLNGTTS